ncbi:MAG: preprotein translocase subunit SecY [Puniceicoccales bacterium]|jgi:preprotein translocase subunit SecY|nr:preprotein translocase subunit SecY [Puniceicoccales bacterium]
MFAGFANFFRVPELRSRLFFTLILIFVARMGANIPLPGLDPVPLRLFFADQVAAARGGGLVGLYNMFTGGAMLKGAIFGLGIMPYISASIVMQLLAVVMPSLAKLQLEGEVGRHRIAQYTRYLTLAICLLQGILLVAALANYPGKLFTGFDPRHYGAIVVAGKSWFFFSSTLFLTTGTLILVWLGDQISQRGIGNGMSLLIVVGILSSLPRSLQQMAQLIFGGGTSGPSWSLRVLQLLGMSALLLAVVLSMIAVTQGQRKIPVQHTKHMVGNRLYSGSSSFLPLKVNYSGVMPIIFGSALLLFPQQIFAYLGGATGMRFFQSASYHLSQGSGSYYVLYALLIFAFSYLWVAMMFQPNQVADELKKNGGYIPGVRPGVATAQFLDFAMTRLTFAGAIFLTAIAILPDFLYFSLHVPYGVALFFGGTGTLITVGVLLEMMRQVETYLVQRNYDGFLKKAKISSQLRHRPRSWKGADGRGLRGLGLGLGTLLAVGLLSWILRMGR